MEKRQIGVAHHGMGVTIPGVGCFDTMGEAQEALEEHFGAVEMIFFESDGFMDKYIIMKV